MVSIDFKAKEKETIPRISAALRSTSSIGSYLMFIHPTVEGRPRIGMVLRLAIPPEPHKRSRQGKPKKGKGMTKALGPGPHHVTSQKESGRIVAIVHLCSGSDAYESPMSI